MFRLLAILAIIWLALRIVPVLIVLALMLANSLT